MKKMNSNGHSSGGLWQKGCKTGLEGEKRLSGERDELHSHAIRV